MLVCRWFFVGVVSEFVTADLNSDLFAFPQEVGRHSGQILGSLHILGNVSALKNEVADGLAELKETGDYVGFARHIRSGLSDSYSKVQ